jgi:hypothetical protein
MPNFLPQTITLTRTASNSADDDKAMQFHARPMPKFKVSIPVVPRDPSKTRSPSKKDKQHDTSFEDFNCTFRAKSLPNLSKPSIPVKNRNSGKLCSPEQNKRPQQQRAPISPPAKTFHARKLPPKFTTPYIPVRGRDPTKLRRSPDGSTEKPSLPEPKPFHARPVPKGLLSPTIPVRGRDSSKLRSPEPKFEKVDPPTFKARPLPNFSKPRDPSPQKGTQKVSSTPADPKGESPPKRMTSKVATKQRVRDRMMGKQGDSNQKPARTNVKTLLQQKKSIPYAPTSMEVIALEESPIPGDVGMCCGVPTTITMPGMGHLAIEQQENATEAKSSMLQAQRVAEEKSRKLLLQLQAQAHRELEEERQEERRRKQGEREVMQRTALLSVSTVNTNSEMESSSEENRRQQQRLATEQAQAHRELEEERQEQQRRKQGERKGMQRTALQSASTVNTNSEMESSSEESRRQQLRLATEQWVSTDSQTPPAGSSSFEFSRQGFSERAAVSDPPTTARGEAARRKIMEEEEEASELSRQREDTIRMAHELQRAAEDELSFHSSLHSKEKGYMGHQGYL